jgi:hypothetical protein
MVQGYRLSLPSDTTGNEHGTWNFHVIIAQTAKIKLSQFLCNWSVKSLLILQCLLKDLEMLYLQVCIEAQSKSLSERRKNVNQSDVQMLYYSALIVASIPSS